MIISTTSDSGKEWPKASEGIHRAKLIEVKDKGIEVSKYADEKTGEFKKQHKIVLIWQVDEDDEDGNPITIGKKFTASVHEKSALRPVVEAHLQRKLNDKETLDTDAIIGTFAMVAVEHNEVGGKVYANVKAVMKDTSARKPSGKALKQEEAPF